MLDILRLCEGRGVLVEWEPRIEGEIRGYYLHPVRTIVIDSSLYECQIRSTIGHELGHAHYQHHYSRATLHLDAERERLADEYAARLLITPEQYAHAEAIAGSGVGALAEHLNVTVDVVLTYQAMIRRGSIQPKRTRRKAG